MAEDLASAAQQQYPSPTGDAAQAAGNYISAALAAAQIYVDRAAARAGRGADRAAGDSIEAARRIYAPMLERDRGRGASSSVTLAAWQAALPYRDLYRDAGRAADRAGDRLRVLHPDAMARFDALRVGLDPVAAMREVAPLITVELANPAARGHFTPMLGQDQGSTATSQEALQAWTSALPLREHMPEADLAASRAEDRLRQLHPEAMARYDALLASHSPTAAAREAAQLVDQRDGTAATPSGSPTGTAARNAAADTRSGGEPPVGPEQTSHQTNTPNGQPVEQVQAYEVVVRQALPDDVAAAVLQDRSWSKLAAALQNAEERGADPATLLAAVAAQREMSTANSPALVLAHRVAHAEETPEPSSTQSSAPGSAQSSEAPIAAAAAPTADAAAPQQQPQQPEGRSAAQVAAQSFPTPLTQAAAPAAADTGQLDTGALAAAGILSREAAALADDGRDAAATADDRSSARVDEHHQGVIEARPLQARSAATDERAAALQAQGVVARTGDRSNSPAGAGSASSAPASAIAAQNFATPLNQAAAPQAGAPPVSPTPAAARPATQAPTQAAPPRRR